MSVIIIYLLISSYIIYRPKLDLIRDQYGNKSKLLLWYSPDSTSNRDYIILYRYDRE